MARPRRDGPEPQRRRFSISERCSGIAEVDVFDQLHPVIEAEVRAPTCRGGDHDQPVVLDVEQVAHNVKCSLTDGA